MIAAGFGCRKGVSAGDVARAFDAALAAAGLRLQDVSCIAIPDFKKVESGILGFAQDAAIPISIITPAAMDAACVRAITHSAFVARHTGLSSIAETAALAATGAASRLLQPRLASGPVTCAIAIGEASS
jgi:cobalt-precorrin 5A hydrolase